MQQHRGLNILEPLLWELVKEYKEIQHLQNLSDASQTMQDS